MQLLSIDVGMRNLAYCLFFINDTKVYEICEWGVINLCNDDTPKCCEIISSGICNKKAQFHKNNSHYCKTHAKKQNFIIPDKNLNIKSISKKKLTELYDLAEIYNIQYERPILKKRLLELFQVYCNEQVFEKIQHRNAEKMDLIELGRNMNDKFNEAFSKYKIDIVIIENQISPIATRMKTLQGMIAQYFIIKDIKEIGFVSSSNKLKEILAINKKTTYSQRKKISINATLEILRHNKHFIDWFEHFRDHSKKDDLADAFLQGIWYINNKKIVDCNIEYLQNK